MPPSAVAVATPPPGMALALASPPFPPGPPLPPRPLAFARVVAPNSAAAAVSPLRAAARFGHCGIVAWIPLRGGGRIAAVAAFVAVAALEGHTSVAAPASLLAGRPCRKGVGAGGR